MAPRLELHNLLKEIVGPNGKVYFQPPANVQMEYPCIVYNRDSAFTRFAGNKLYRYHKRYQVTVIDRNPDSEIPDKVIALPLASFERWFAADNLNHDVFTIYF